MQKTRVHSLPECDLCGDGTEARYDSPIRMKMGSSWGYLCEEHFESHGSPGGTKLELIESTDPDPETAGTVPTVSFGLEAAAIGTPEVECPHCGGGRRVEPDANYQVTCEFCGEDYKVRSPI